MKASSLIAKHWKDHWPSVLIGAGIVIGGLYMVFVNASYFFGLLLIVVGVIAMILEDLEDLSTCRYYILVLGAYMVAGGLYSVFVAAHYFLGLLLIVVGVVVIAVGVAWGEDSDATNGVLSRD